MGIQLKPILYKCDFLGITPQLKILNENSYKSIQFLLTNINSYDYVHVYYSRTAGADNLERSVNVKKVLNRFRVREGVCSIHITGNENTLDLPVEELSEDFFIPATAKQH